MPRQSIRNRRLGPPDSRSILALSMLILLLPARVLAQNSVEALEERAFQQATIQAAPCVVRIDTVGGLDQVQPGVTASGATTGLIVSSEGEVISSAFHFAAKPTSILITLADDRRFPAKLVATDRQRMVTLLKIDAERLPTPAFVPRNDIRVGQWSLALGRTFDAATPSVSVGMISAINRVWGKAVQTDAKVSPVNYGGPLVDIGGRVQGVLVPLSPHEGGETAGVEWYDSGIGFAVPLDDILAVLPRLREGKDLSPGLLGVSFRGKDLNAKDVVVDRVRFDSPADQAGIKAGDRLTKVDGQPIRRMSDLKQVLGRKYADDPLELVYERDMRSTTARLKLVGELKAHQAGYLGILLERSTPQDQLVVRHVFPKTPAATAGIQPGDKIVRWNREAMTSRSEFRTAVRRLRPGTPAPLIVQRSEEVTLEVQLANYPDAVPDNVPSEVLPAEGTTPAENLPKTGRWSETLPGHDREFWAYVPERPRGTLPLGLLIFLHPTLDTQEGAVLAAWKTECERRGIILLAPKCDAASGWTPNDVEFITDSIALIRERYPIASDRICLHAIGNSVPVGLVATLKTRQTIRGFAAIEPASFGALPENEFEHPIQLFFAPADDKADTEKFKLLVPKLRSAGYPVVFSTYSASSVAYPSGDLIEEIARWFDSLDRL